MTRKKYVFILFISIFILFNLSLVIACNNTTNNIKNYFRIHVVANSDSIQDQMLKLQVAKDIDEYIQNITKDSYNNVEYIDSISNHIYEILDIAHKTILEQKENYEVYALVGNIKYDEKSKNNISMKAGIYNSLKIVIGDGNGENWWSLLFPHSIEGMENTDDIYNTDITYSSGILTLFTNFFDIFK